MISAIFDCFAYSISEVILSNAVSEITALIKFFGSSGLPILNSLRSAIKCFLTSSQIFFGI